MRQREHHPLTAAEQFLALRGNPIGTGGVGSVRAGRLEWRCSVRPTPLSRVYSLHLAYQQGGTPITTVTAPDLTELAGGRPLPHVYTQRPPRLCLYLPREQQWRPSLRLDETILPWAVLWLFYFEEWLVSDEWKGGGVHPSAGKRP